MNRAEKRRQRKVTEKAAKNASPVPTADPSPEQRQPLALQHYNAGQLPEAEALCRQILKADPDRPVVLHLLGVIAVQLGKPEAAADLIARALALKPDYGAAHGNLGLALKKLGKLEDAVASYRKAIAFDPSSAAAHNNLGNVLREMDKPGEALPNLRQALTLQPGYAEAHNNLGIALLDLGKPGEAVASFDAAIAIAPGSAEAQSNLGNALKELNKLDQAVESYQRALALKPDYADAHTNLGNALQEMGRLDAAIASIEKAISIEPDNANPHWDLSLPLLQRGDFKRGREEYDWRSKKQKSGTRIFPIETWPGSSLQGKSIFVYAEQGVGDEILFSSCLPDLIQHSPKKIYLECDPRLAPLFARSFPEIQVCGKAKDFDLSWIGGDVRPDYCLPIGSLPRFFRNHLEDFPKRDAFLVADAKRAAHWKARLDALGKGLKVGISWRGGLPNITERVSILLADWQGLLSLPAIFINLQYGDAAAEIAQLRQASGITLHDWPDNDPRVDLDAQAALISCLDLVISIDNTTVHSAGALGTSVWNMLDTAKNMMWLENFGETTPLYSKVRLFHKQPADEWADVLGRVEREFRQFIESATVATD
jgi:tetratricopeptide (TPR) repeat protein